MTDYAKLKLEQKKKEAFATQKGADEWRVNESSEFFRNVGKELDSELKKARRDGFDFSKIPAEGMQSTGEIRLSTSTDQLLKCSVSLKDEENSYPVRYFIQAKLEGVDDGTLRYRLDEEEWGFTASRDEPGTSPVGQSKASPEQIAETIMRGTIKGHFD